MMAARQGVLPLLPFDLDGVVAELRRTTFPGIEGDVACRFSAEIEVVAQITTEPWPGCRGDIEVNTALNVPGTPIEVIRAIVKHELLHLVAPPELVRRWGRWYREIHPQAFLMRQFETAPEFQTACEWLKRNFGRQLKTDRDGSLVIHGRRVRKGGRRRVAKAPDPD